MHKQAAEAQGTPGISLRRLRIFALDILHHIKASATAPGPSTPSNGQQLSATAQLCRRMDSRSPMPIALSFGVQGTQTPREEKNEQLSWT